MRLIPSAKGEFLKVLLGKLTHGDTGSTLLGAAAAGVLASGVNLSDLFGSDSQKQAQAAGTIAGALVVAVWGYFIGKKPVLSERKR